MLYDKNTRQMILLHLQRDTQFWLILISYTVKTLDRYLN